MARNQNNNRTTLRRWLGLFMVVIITAGLAAMTLLPRRNYDQKSIYLTMHDGVKIAVDVWLPTNLAPGEKLPAVMRSTGYWRSYQFGPLGRLIDRLGLIPEELNEAKGWVEAGYALVTVDVRGTGASFGQWTIPWSQEEIADLGQVVDWIIEQPWSNGRVGAYGVSYDGNTAEMLASLNHPAVKAVAPQFSDFDLQGNLVHPGGVFNQRFMQGWDEFHNRLGANDVCALATAAKMDCDQMRYMVSGVKPVDDDPNGEQLAQAVAGHSSHDLFAIGQAIEFRDDLYGQTDLTLSDVSPYTQREAIEVGDTPMYVWVSWLDSGTVEGALARYGTFSNPQTLIIGPWSHGGSYHADPFLPEDTPTDPAYQEQFRMLVAFFDAYLKDTGAAAPDQNITYYTLGEGKWKQTETWPPEGFSKVRWYFGPDGLLTLQAPTSESGVDEYQVDWTTTSGQLNRWYTGLFKDDVVYTDRALEDRKLLTYTSSPMTADVEITGSPNIGLYLNSSESDGAFYAYLEDVAPDGRVTYITEGILRAIQRAESESSPPYIQSGPYHSFQRVNAVPLVPGEVTEMRLNLYSTSVLIRQGHSLRIAIAGHDASTFARYPADGTPVIQVQRNRIYPSYIDLPMMER